MKRTEVVVVTGASAGVGRAIARRFARDGARIGLLARNEKGLEATRAEVESAGGQALVLPCDVADFAAVDVAASAVEQAFGPIDVWINNAMTTVFAPFADVTPEEFARATEVTYLGTVWGTRAAMERMRSRERGTIVLVGSALAYRGIPLQSAYCGAKHAEKGFFESLRTELRHDGSRIHLTMVQLPGLNTPQFNHCRTRLPREPRPVPPVYQPEIAADAVHFAAHARRRELYVGMPTVRTIVANKLVPSLVERRLAATGYEAQQTDRPVARDVHGNLFEAPARDEGAHGRFDDESRSRSLQWLASRHRRALVAAAATGVAAAVAGLRRARS